MSHVSTMPWVEQLSARAGTMDRFKVENFFARKIIMVGTTLAILVDEFQPATVVFSATSERLVRRLVVL